MEYVYSKKNDIISKIIIISVLFIVFFVFIVLNQPKKKKTIEERLEELESRVEILEYQYIKYTYND